MMYYTELCKKCVHFEIKDKEKKITRCMWKRIKDIIFRNSTSVDLMEVGLELTEEIRKGYRIFEIRDMEITFFEDDGTIQISHEPGTYITIDELSRIVERIKEIIRE